MQYTLVSGEPGESDYTPYGAVRDFFYCKDPEIIVSGAAETGKTRGVLEWLHLKAAYYKDASIVIARKQLTDVYSTVLQTYIEKVLRDEIGVTVFPYGGEKPQWFDYKVTGSRIWVAGLDKPQKILSGEFDIVYVNQVEEISLVDWETLSTRVTGRAGHIPNPQLIGDCNPGPPSHWIKSRSRDGPLTLIPTTHRDNPVLYHQEPDPRAGELTDQGERALDRLRTLTGSRKQRLFHGLWVAPEGAIYEVFEEARHVVKSFPIPQLWPRTVGVDPVGAAVAAVWLAWDPQAHVLNVYREYSQPFGIPTRQHVENVKKLSRNEAVHAWVVGAISERQPRQDWIDAGIPAIPPPYSDVWAGIDKVNELLADNRLFIHDCCPGLISDVSDYHRKQGKDGEPGETIEGKEKYHLADCLRYSVAWLTAPATGQVRVGYEAVPIGERRY